jgi:hypothetical protein
MSSPSLLQKILGWILKIIAGILLLSLLLALIAFFTVKYQGVPTLMNYLSKQSGFAFAVEQQKVDLIHGRLELQGLSIANSSSFVEQRLSYIPSVVADIATDSLRAEPYRIAELSLHLSELNIITDKNGQRNVELLARAFAPAPTNTTTSPQATTSANTAQAPMPALLINKLHLRADTLRLIDERTNPARISQVALNFNFERSNVSDLNALQAELTQEALTIAFAKAGPLIISELKGNALVGSSKLAEGALEGSAQAVDRAVEATNKAVDTLNSATQTFKGLFNKITE